MTETLSYNTSEDPISRFSLMPKQRRELQKFFDENFFELSNDHPLALEGLKDCLRRVLPEATLQRLADVFSGKSDEALIICNLPEKKRKWRETDINSMIERNAYSYYIGNALYAMNNMESAVVKPLIREGSALTRGPHHKIKARNSVTGNYIHRDMINGGKYIFFSCLHNKERAFTKIIYLKKAVESLPEEKRKEIKVKAYAANSPRGDQYDTINLAELLKRLSEPNGSQEFFRTIELADDTDEKAKKEFDDAIEKHSVKVLLEKGQLLAINEDTMFHYTEKGLQRGIRPNTLSRIIIHHAGRKIENTSSEISL